MNIWSGAIRVGEQSLLQDLQLIDRSASWQSGILKSRTLSLKSFVNPALIPLYARVGPSLELHTSNPESSQWLKHKLLENVWLGDEDDLFQPIQCPVGFLLDLNGATRPRASGPSSTDLLVYGTLSTTTTSYKRPPTPPILSSSENDGAASCTIKQELRIFAMPISGSLITRAQALPDRENSETITGQEQFGRFLPDVHSPSAKRKRVETLFESVVQHHKRVRHKGGEAVSQLMAQSILQPSHQLQNYRIKREPEEPGLQTLSKIASHRPRSLSISSNLKPNKLVEHRHELSRPSSSWNRATQLSSKGPTPVPGLPTEATTRKGSVSAPDLLSEPSSEKKTAETIISDNKNIITRTILTCMRLYGFNRAARPKTLSHNDMLPPLIEGRDSQVAGDSVTLPASSTSTDEDEFKAMYHATYRASTFALRKYLREPLVADGGSKPAPPVLEKQKAMTCIDGFLKLFCEEDH